MAMIITFEAPYGQRILKSQFRGITTWRKDSDKPILWWDHDKREWTTDLTGRGLCSTHAPCRSYNAFLRHIKKHKHMLQGYEIELVNRFIGYCVKVVL